MSDIDRQMAQMHQKVATENSQKAVALATENKKELEDQVTRLNYIVNTLTQQVQDLNRKYNLLLSERFNTGPTEQ